MRSPRFVSSFLVVALLTAPVRAQNLWIVDANGGPGADYTDLTSAFSGAADGDVLLVRSGYYSGMYADVDDRELTVAADEGGATVNFPNLFVRNLSASKRVVVRGITFMNASVQVGNNQGLVWFEDCAFLADQYFGSQGAALSVWNSRLVLKGCYLHGSPPYAFYGLPATTGLSLSGSIASLTDVIIHGGDGDDTSFGNFSGAKALAANNSVLVLSKAMLKGGRAYSMPGGTGLALTNGATAWLSSVQASGGSGTPAGDATTVDASSSLIPVAVSTRTLTSSSPVRHGGLLTVTVQGVPGEAVVLKTGLEPALALDGAGSFRLIQPIPAMSRFLGVVPAGGTLTFSSPVPDLGALPCLELFLQAWHIDARGHTRAAPGTPNFPGKQGPGTSVLQLGEGY